MADLEFSAAAALALRRVTAVGHGDAVVRHGGVEVTAAELAEQLAARALEIAELFDGRNNTARQGDWVHHVLAAQPVVDRLTLSGLARRASPPPKPSTVDVYPESAAALAALAERETRLQNTATARAAWQRFDERAPHPPELLGRRLNARGAELLGEQSIDEVHEVWGRAVELFERAGNTVLAAAVRQRLGVLLCLTGSAQEGLDQVREAAEEIAQGGDIEQRVLSATRLAQILALSERYDDAIAVLDGARPLADGEPIWSAELAVRLAEFTARTEDFPAALVHAERAIALYASVGISEVLRQAQLVTGRLRAATGDLDGAYEVLGEAALALDSDQRFVALHVRGTVAIDLDRPDLACAALTDAVVCGGPDVAYTAVELAVTCLQADRPDQAADAAEEAIAGLTKLDDPAELVRARFLLASAYRELGQRDHALTLLDDLAEQCAARDEHGGAGQMHAMAADILDGLDRDEPAALRYEQAAAAYRSAGLALAELANRRGAALSWHWAGDEDRSRAALREAERVAATVPADDSEPAWEHALLGYDGARIYAAAGRPSEALPRALAAQEGFAALGAPEQATMAACLRGRLLLDLERSEEAREVLTAALHELPDDAVVQRQQVRALLRDTGAT